MKTERGKRVKLRPRRRNPVARTLRDPAFRARREANRRRYSRKLKHKPSPDSDDGSGERAEPACPAERAAER